MKLHPEPTNYSPDCFIATCDDDGRPYMCFRMTFRKYNDRLNNCNSPWPNWLWPDVMRGGITDMSKWEINPGAGYNYISGNFGDILVARKMEMLREQMYCIEPDVYSEKDFLARYTPETPTHMRGEASYEIKNPHL